MEFKTIELKESIFANNDREADRLRAELKGDKTVLREFLSCFPLILRAFPAFCLSVIRCADHKKRPFFIQQ